MVKPLLYRTGEEIRKGDRVLLHRETGEIDLVLDGENNPEAWPAEKYGRGIMISEPKPLGICFSMRRTSQPTKIWNLLPDLAIPSRPPTQLPRYNQSMRLAVLASLLLSLLTVLPAQEKPKSALDKTHMEAYVRHLLAVHSRSAGEDRRPQTVRYLRPAGSGCSLHLPGPLAGRNVLSHQGRPAHHSRRGLQLRPESFSGRSRQIEDQRRSQLRPGQRPGHRGRVRRFRMSQLQGRSQNVARQCPIASFPPQVHVYFKDFPLEQIHPWAKAASIAGRCIYHQSPAAFWKYHDWIYDHQAEITARQSEDPGDGFRQDRPGHSTACSSGAASTPRPPRPKWMPPSPRDARCTWMPRRPYF